MKTAYDLIVVGGGIAGMTAAIYGARSNLYTLVLEQEICGGLANWTHVVENFPSHTSIHGMELMEKTREQMLACGVELKEVIEVEDISLKGAEKIVTTDEGSFSAQAIILAMGRKPVQLPVEHDWDDHVHYCSLCDGNIYTGKNVLVVGGGNSAFDESLYLEGLGVRSITIIEAMEKCPAAESTIQRALATGKIKVLTSTLLTGIEPEGDRAILRLKNTEHGEENTLDVDGIFVFIGQKPATTQFRDILELDQYGYLKTDADLQTNIAGVYAAGDIVSKKYRQLTTAMSDGTIAALEAHRFLCR